MCGRCVDGRLAPVSFFYYPSKYLFRKVIGGMGVILSIKNNYCLRFMNSSKVFKDIRHLSNQ